LNTIYFQFSGKRFLKKRAITSINRIKLNLFLDSVSCSIQRDAETSSAWLWCVKLCSAFKSKV